jgi:ATP-dependent RNA helicase SUPV3L1/SUV3
VRIDILERLADLIRLLLAWRPETPGDNAPAGATGDGGFTIVPDMMSILGCSPDELGAVLKALGFWVERREVAPYAARPAPELPAEATGTALAETSAAPLEDAPTPQVAEATAVPGAEASAQAEPTPPPPVEGAASTTPASDEIAAPASDAEVAAEAETSGAPAAESVPEPNPVSDTVSAEPAGEAHAASGEAQAAPSAEAAAQPEVIEIWRPRRHRTDRNQPRDRRRGRRGQGGQPRVAAAPAGEQPAAGAAAASDQPAGDKPRERHQQRGRDKDRHGSGRDRGAEQKGGRPNKRDRDRRSGGKRRDEPRSPQVISSGPRQSKKGAVDPDSPFAALGALKDAMTKQSEEKAP